MTEVLVDVEEAARKVLRDPKGLASVSQADLIALARFALGQIAEPAALQTHFKEEFPNGTDAD